jgi:deazaflavin-dependent oxidoreductase (nitroreductase family)
MSELVWIAIAVLAGVAAAPGLVVFRFGARGDRAVRLLARMLHRSARRTAMARRSSALHVRVYRLTRGLIGGWWFGSRAMVIETRGRKTGQPRRTAVIYVADGDRLAVTPANAGVDSTPNWYLNLQADPRATVTIGGRRLEVLAREAEESERDRLWDLIVRAAPATAEYQRYTFRRFPVVVLEPAPGSGPHASAA